MRIIKALKGPSFNGGGGPGSSSSYVYKSSERDNSQFFDWLCDRIVEVLPGYNYNVELGFDESSDAVVVFFPSNKEAEYYKAFSAFAQGADDRDDEEDDRVQEQYDKTLTKIKAFSIGLHWRRFDVGQETDEMLAEFGVASNFGLCSEQMTEFENAGKKRWSVTVTIDKLKGKYVKPKALPVGPVSESTFNVNNTNYAEYRDWAITTIMKLTGWVRVDGKINFVLVPPAKKVWAEQLAKKDRHGKHAGDGGPAANAWVEAGFFTAEQDPSNFGMDGYRNEGVLGKYKIAANLQDGDQARFTSKVVPVTIKKVGK